MTRIAWWSAAALTLALLGLILWAVAVVTAWWVAVLVLFGCSGAGFGLMVLAGVWADVRHERRERERRAEPSHARRRWAWLGGRAGRKAISITEAEVQRRASVLVAEVTAYLRERAEQL